ncbi:MAG: glycosyltransferase N-terminal domain-containing protein [Candidatus Hydrogenedentota bacterium]
MILHTFYNIIVSSSIPVLKLLQYRNEKIKLFISERKNLFLNLSNKIQYPENKKRIWFHSTSVGEFEQAKPLIEILKSRYDTYIILSVFSSSIYKNALKYRFVDVITYLPFDTIFNAKRFVNIVKPDIFITVKFDLWPNHLITAKKYGAKTLLVDATLQPESCRLLPIIKNFYQYVHRHLDYVFTVSEYDTERFKPLLDKNTKLLTIGDTRFDSVHKRYLDSIKGSSSLRFESGDVKVILGSVWPEDIKVVLAPSLDIVSKNNVILIVVPHEIDKKFINTIETQIKDKGLKYTKWTNLGNEKCITKDISVVIVDAVGILANLYLLTDIAYVGGSFSTGVHNTMEPGICGQPVVFGPVYYNSPEACKLVDLGVGFSIKSSKEFKNIILDLINDSIKRKHLGLTARDFIMKSIGASDKIIEIMRISNLL